MPTRDRQAWAWVTRTYLFDRFVSEEIARGADMVVNLAAGFDARPYRMALPAALRWVEVDLPELLEEKSAALRGEEPACALERRALDLSNAGARRDLFRELGKAARQALILTEGLLIYLTPAGVGALAEDLAAPMSFQRWALDIVSPGLLRMLQRQIGSPLDRAQAPLKFGPQEGPNFFVPHGWQPVAVESVLKTAARVKRLPPWMRILAALPELAGRQGSRPWSAVCLMARAAA